MTLMPDPNNPIAIGAVIGILRGVTLVIRKLTRDRFDVPGWTIAAAVFFFYVYFSLCWEIIREHHHFSG
jgi:hypothetical protein